MIVFKGIYQILICKMENIPEKLHISTMTFISEIDSNIELKNLYKKLDIDDEIKYIEYGKNPEKGEKITKIKKPRQKKEKNISIIN